MSFTSSLFSCNLAHPSCLVHHLSTLTLWHRCHPTTSSLLFSPSLCFSLFCLYQTDTIQPTDLICITWDLKNKNGSLLPSLIYNRGAILGIYCFSFCLSVCMATGLLGTNHYYCWLCLQYYSMFASIERVIPYIKYELKCFFLFI